MITLAIDLSSPRGSVALLRDADVAASRGWIDAKERSGPLFGAIRDVLTEAGVTIDRVDLFAAGRGPGNYSGMRVALTTAQALALPAGRDVAACSSGAALAGAVLGDMPGGAAPRSRPAGTVAVGPNGGLRVEADAHHRIAPVADLNVEKVAVVGDARRGQFWFAVFGAAEVADGLPCGEHTWTLCPYAELGTHLPDGARIVTAEWERVRSLCPPGVRDGGAWIEGGRFPEAADVARLVLTRRRAGRPSEPLAPLYLHPAVM